MLLSILTVANIAVGIYLFMSGPSQAFSVFLIGTFIGILMYVTLHGFQNLLPWIFQEQKGNYYVKSSEYS